MDEKITITIHVMSPRKKIGKFRDQINLFADEPVTEKMNITSVLHRHFIPDMETMLVLAIKDYLGKNGG